VQDVIRCKGCDAELIDDEDEYCLTCWRDIEDADEADRAYEKWRDRQMEIEISKRLEP
jgi:hypothetical protein